MVHFPEVDAGFPKHDRDHGWVDTSIGFYLWPVNSVDVGHLVLLISLAGSAVEREELHLQVVVVLIVHEVL